MAGRQRFSKTFARVVAVVAILTLSMWPRAAIAMALGEDVAPTVPENVQAIPSTHDIMLSWDPSTDDIGVAGYLIHRNYTYLAWVPSGTTFTDTTVVAGMTYRYQIRAQDGAGNNSAPSPRVLVDFQLAPDTTPPTIPTNVTATEAGTSVVVSWDPASDDVALKGYLVHRDTVYLGWVPIGTTFTDSTVVPGVTYQYVVRSQDTSDNNSAPSAPVTLTTLDPPFDPPLDGLDGLIVTSWGNDATADGSARFPYGSVSAAVLAAPDDTAIYVSNGVFRESVDLEARSLQIRAVPGARPVLSGADVATAWTEQDGMWFTQGPVHPHSGWPDGMTSSARSGLVDIVVLDGTQLTQVMSAVEVGPDSFWVDGQGQVWIGADPADSIVEIAVRERAIFARGVDGFEVDGLTVRHYVGGPGDRGAIEIWGTNAIVRDVTAHDNANAGVRLLGATPLVERLQSERNGRIGLTMHNVDDGVVRESTISDNNTEEFNPFGAAGGIKVTASRNVTISDNTVDDNDGHGIWFDLSSVGLLIDENVARYNTEAGILVEVSAQATVHANTSSHNGRGVYIVESNDVAVTSNTVSFNDRNILVLDGYREGEGCIDREVGAIFTPPIDERFGCQWPLVKWNVDTIEISGNAIVGGSPLSGNRAMIEINHVAHPAGDIDGEDRRTSAEVMAVTIGANNFERIEPALPRWVVAWSQWPSHMSVHEDLATFTAATGQAVGSTYAGP